jgi:hypothetical protein
MIITRYNHDCSKLDSHQVVQSYFLYKYILFILQKFSRFSPLRYAHGTTLDFPFIFPISNIYPSSVKVVGFHYFILPLAFSLIFLFFFLQVVPSTFYFLRVFCFILLFSLTFFYRWFLVHLFFFVFLLYFFYFLLLILFYFFFL